MSIVRNYLTLLVVPILGMVALLFVACDPEGRKNCDWVLEPEIRKKDFVEPGFIPLCARNRVTMKQDCRLQATEAQTRSFLGKRFRYVDLKVKSPALPRTIQSVRFCNE